jgi:hypothetical protein
MILAIDLGFGHFKYAVFDQVNTKLIKLDKEVNGVVEVPKGDDSMISTVSTYHNFEGKRYLIGELATKLDIEPINTLQYEGFKLVGPIITSYLLSKFSSNNIDKISIGITPAIWDKRDDYKSYMLEKLDIPENKLDLHIQGVSGHSTYINFGLDIDPNNTKIDMSTKSHNYVGLDFGFNTIDSYLVINDSILDYGIKGYLNKGIVLVSDKIKEYIFTHLGVKITDVEAKEVLSLGGLKKRAKFINLSDKISEFIVEYLSNTFEMLEEEYGDQFNKIDNILAFGGGAEVIKIYMEKSDKIKSTIDELYGDGFLLIPKNKSEYYNTIGYSLLSSK